MIKYMRQSVNNGDSRQRVNSSFTSFVTLL